MVVPPTAEGSAGSAAIPVRSNRGNGSPAPLLGG